MKLNIPNALTIIRIIIAPLVFIMIYNGGSWIAFGTVIFILGALSDWLDGYLARRNKQVTGFGQFMDPVADKLLSGFGLASIASIGYAKVIPIIGIILRDVLTTSFRLWGISKNVKILPSKLAKMKTAIELTTLIVIMLYATIGGDASGFRLGTVAIYIVLILAWVTLADYFWKNRKLII